jgi:16S rRNA C967 or C1407 C5-methylase (RsmB/RsmF family)
MGKRKHFGRRKYKQKDPSALELEPSQPEKRDTNYEAIITENVSLDKYYRNCGIFSESNLQDWEQCYETLKNPLPSTIRISGLDMNDFISRKTKLEQVYFASLPCSDKNQEDLLPPPPKPLPFYEPLGRAWVIYATRTLLRKDKAYKVLHDYLVRETELGNISRQEAVSMLPPLFLDIKSEHMVLDMCAAPGSKTCQLVEMLHLNTAERVDHTDPLAGHSAFLPTGVIVANDVDEQRACMLVHQLKRLNSPCVMVTNHDASMFPGQEGTFDRVLCDVPCSGDGTFRKNKLMWKTWTHKSAHALHPLQLRILKRGCMLLKVGGRLVYSTCSMNPIENEAVISALFQEYPNTFKLIDVSNHLPGLITRPGVRSWKVYSDPDQITLGAEDEPLPKGIKPTFFPPDFSKVSEADIPLDRCLRLYPHLQDTGGFFIAVLEKITPMTKHQAKFTKEEHTVEPITKSIKIKDAWSDPITFLDPETSPDHNSIIECIKEAYQVKEDFPFDLIVQRHEQKRSDPSINANLLTGNLFLISKGILSLMNHSSLASPHNMIKILSCGLKLFTRCDRAIASESDSPAFRIQYECLPFILRFMRNSNRLVSVSNWQDVLLLLREEYPQIQTLTMDLQQCVAKCQTQACYLFYYSPISDQDQEKSTSWKRFIAPVWIGKTSLNCLINKREKQSLLDLWT